MIKITPFEILEKVIRKGMIMDYHNPPGTVINKLTLEEREILNDLRSDDLQVRVDEFFIRRSE